MKFLQRQLLLISWKLILITKTSHLDWPIDCIDNESYKRRAFLFFTYLFNVKGFLKIVSNNTIKIFCRITRIFRTLNWYLKKIMKTLRLYTYILLMVIKFGTKFTFSNNQVSSSKQELSNFDCRRDACSSMVIRETRKKSEWKQTRCWRSGDGIRLSLMFPEFASTLDAICG